MEPAGSRLVILSVVPMVMALPESAPAVVSSFTPPQAVRDAMAATETAAARIFLEFNRNPLS